MVTARTSQPCAYGSLHLPHRSVNSTDVGQYSTAWGPLMAGALIASIPVAVVYTYFLDRFVAGFTMGAVK